MSIEIGPGVLCRLLHCDHNPEWVGRIVTAMSRPEEDYGITIDGVVERGLYVYVDAPWMSAPPGTRYRYWSCQKSWLQPIAGPGLVDADAETVGDEVTA